MDKLFTLILKLSHKTNCGVLNVHFLCNTLHTCKVLTTKVETKNVGMASYLNNL